MVPELAIACLACARIGAAHSVIFGGFSSQAIVDRVIDADSKVVITCDGAWRRGKIVPLKHNLDAACDDLAAAGHAVESVIVLKRCNNGTAWHEGRDHDYHQLVSAAHSERPCEPLDAEDMAFLLYTSGSTGKPKGIKHTVGGYMVYTYITSKYVFNLIPDADHVFWCTADVGWVTGHSYIIYGILSNRVPSLMYEGAPNFPAEDRFWDIVQRHKVTQFYTAPTAIRAFMKWGRAHPDKHDLSSLKVLGTVGEPINPEAWMWYHQVIGRERCPIVDTWWQTETGGHMITPLPGVTPTKPGSCTLPFFGIDAAILDECGVEQPHGTGGLLAIRIGPPGILELFKAVEDLILLPLSEELNTTPSRVFRKIIVNPTDLKRSTIHINGLANRITVSKESQCSGGRNQNGRLIVLVESAFHQVYVKHGEEIRLNVHTHFRIFFIPDSNCVRIIMTGHRYIHEIGPIVLPDLIAQWPRHIRPRVNLTVVGHVLDHLADAVVIGKLLVERYLVVDPQAYDDGDGHANSQSGNVDESMEFVLHHVLHCCPEITSVHICRIGG
jgi:hypothetical protein